MKKLKFTDGQDLYKESYKYQSQGIIDEFKKTLLSVLEDTTRIQGGILFGWNINTLGDQIQIYHSTSTGGACINKNGQIIYSSTGSIISLIDYSLGAINTIVVKYKDFEYYNQYNQIKDKYENVKITDSFQVDVYTSTGWINLTQSQRDEYVILGQAIGQGIGNTPIINESLRIYLGGRLRQQSITENMLSPTFKIYQTIVRNSQIYNDNFSDSKIDLEDDLNELRTKIREMQGTVHYTDPVPGTLSNFDDDLNALHGEGVFKGTWNEFSLSTSTGFIIYIETGKGIVSKKVVRNQTIIPLVIDESSKFIVGNWDTKTEYEVLTFGAQPDVQYLSHDDVVQGTLHLTQTDNAELVENVDFTIDYDTGCITSIVGGNVSNEDIRCYYQYSLPRIDIVQINKDSILSIKKGNAQDNPIEPNSDIENIKLWAIKVNENVSHIANDAIIDRRNYLDTIPNIKSADIIIETQANFEYYFGDGTETGTGTTGAGFSYSESGGKVTVTIPRKYNIFLKSNPTDGTIDHFKYDATNFPYKAYNLKTTLLMKGELVMQGSGIDETIIIKGNNNAGFETNYLHTKSGCDSSAGSNVITLSNTSNLKEGQTIFFDGDNGFYKIIAITADTNISVDRNIETAYSAKSIYILTENIMMKELTIDGRGGVHGLGGSMTHRPFVLEYCGNSKFTGKFVNGNHPSHNGGMFFCYANYKNEFNNISNSSASQGSGGGLYLNSSNNNTVSDISNNTAYEAGGVYLYLSNNNTISNVSNNSSSNNGGGGLTLRSSINNIISNVYNNSSSGAYNGGGGVFLYSSSINNIISNVYNNSSANNGGGLYLYSSSNIISNVYNNSSNHYGGGVYIGSSKHLLNDTWIGNTAGTSGNTVYVDSGSYARSGNFNGTLYRDTSWQTSSF